MRKIYVAIFMLLILSACSKNTHIEQPTPNSISTLEQEDLDFNSTSQNNENL